MKEKIVVYFMIAILAMTSVASANPAFMQLTPENIVIIPDGTTVTEVDVLVYDIAYSALGTPHDRSISVETSSGLEARITGNGVDTGWTTSLATDQWQAVSGDYTFKLEVRGTNTGFVTVHDNAGDSYSTAVTADVARETPHVAVPEFPTVALPVAAILGLAFLMQRRKEE